MASLLCTIAYRKVAGTFQLVCHVLKPEDNQVPNSRQKGFIPKLEHVPQSKRLCCDPCWSWHNVPLLSAQQSKLWGSKQCHYCSLISTHVAFLEKKNGSLATSQTPLFYPQGRPWPGSQTADCTGEPASYPPELPGRSFEL